MGDITKDILLNFSNGNYSYNDYLKIKNIFENEDIDSDVRDLLFEQWEELIKENNNEESLNNLFEKIHYRILLEDKKRLKRIILWKRYTQVAAIFLIPVISFLLWFYISTEVNNPGYSQAEGIENISQPKVESWIEINVPLGSRVKFSLPDGSVGWLNSGSKLKYPSVMGVHRKVKLIGEAYFDIKHIEGSDFVVNVEDMNIKVLGTKFNVSAYSDDAFTSVVLKEGQVEVIGENEVFNQMLLPNEKITFNHEIKTLKLSKVDASRYSAWKDGFLIIENEPLCQVIGRLERWYNVEIIVKDEKLSHYRFKATFKDEPLEEVLKLIAKTTPIKYNIEKRVMNSNGVVIKKRITMKLKE